MDAALPLEGENLVPLFQQQSVPQRDAIFFHFPNYAWHMDNRLGGAVRSGKFKLINHYDDDSVELYDLSADLSETRDLSLQMPKKTAELKGRLKAWLHETGAKMPRRK